MKAQLHTLGVSKECNPNVLQMVDTEDAQCE